MSSTQACGRTVCLALVWMITGLPLCPGTPGAMQDSSRELLTLVGSVLRDDGTPPPFGVTIERDCGSGYKKEGFTDSSGYFSFQVGRGPLSNGTPSNDRPIDESIWQVAMDRRQAPPPFEIGFCMLRARVPGYRSSVVRVSGDPGSMKVDVGRIVLSPDKKAKSAIVSLTGLRVPKEAVKSMDRAKQAMQKGEFARAAENLHTALSIYPQYAEAWYRLGYVDQHRQLFPEAEEAFNKAIAIDSNYAPPYMGLASVAWSRQDWAQMVDWSGRCIKLNPLAFPEAYFLNSVALYRMNMLDAAEEIARKGQQVDVAHRFAKIHLLLAEILFSKKNVSASAQEMRDYLKFARNAPDAEQVRAVLKQREESSRQSSMNSTENR